MVVRAALQTAVGNLQSWHAAQRCTFLKIAASDIFSVLRHHHCRIPKAPSVRACTCFPSSAHPRTRSYQTSPHFAISASKYSLLVAESFPAKTVLQQVPRQNTTSATRNNLMTSSYCTTSQQAPTTAQSLRIFKPTPHPIAARTSSALLARTNGAIPLTVLLSFQSAESLSCNYPSKVASSLLANNYVKQLECKQSCNSQLAVRLRRPFSPLVSCKHFRSGPNASPSKSLPHSSSLRLLNQTQLSHTHRQLSSQTAQVTPNVRGGLTMVTSEDEGGVRGNVDEAVKALEKKLGAPIDHGPQVPPPKPLVIIISGPSGVGKDAVIKVRYGPRITDCSLV